jgi:hypothetical protein
MGRVNPAGKLNAGVTVAMMTVSVLISLDVFRLEGVG